MSQDDSNVEQQRVELGQRLRQAREYVGLSQDDVASVLGVSRPAITLIESGGRKVEAIELNKLATLFGATVEYLLTGQKTVTVEDEKLAFLARATQGLSNADMEQLLRFTDYLRNSSITTRRGK
ncbi:helix-turn-helix domain-containing protein [Burkholderia ubonensis]|uniref:helix-turn-helix domain-containing protein n=1 Tax=Burkholderia ubonensis TaxID=101571 RepID=UPI0009B43B13|nr:helix-turn-helix transcriptional regulator [Burkholderia ubonensis]